MSANQEIILSKKECNSILDLMKNTKPINSNIVIKNSLISKILYRNSIEYNIELPDFLKDILKDKLYKYGIKNLPINFKVLKYTKGSYFKKHIDNNGAPETLYRYKSMVIQLSEDTDYTGGDLKLFFNKNTLEFNREQGNMILFDSSVAHEVSEVLNGVRYTLVCWFDCSSFEIKKNIL